MTGLHESTLALSIYNAIARTGALSREQLASFLKANWDGQVDLSEIDDGVRYLTKRGMITMIDGSIVPSKLENGAARTVIRKPDKLTELMFGGRAVARSA
jgi:hypothetical protein